MWRPQNRLYNVSMRIQQEDRRLIPTFSHSGSTPAAFDDFESLAKSGPLLYEILERLFSQRSSGMQPPRGVE